MRSVRELGELVNDVLPAHPDRADLYRTLSGAWIAGGGFMGGETLDWAERTSHHATDPVTALGVVATAAVTGTAALLWDRASRAEENY